MAKATSSRATREADPGPGAGRLIHVRLPDDLHRSLRVHVATNDTSIQNWVAALIARELGSPSRSSLVERAGGRRK